ncbi:Uncharacterised protein [Mycobacteroides abscessus subsp. abscessus]|nr:Uncharacterised protein [Mycobacteroides abscessus subsp. abscessus]SLK64287.1 Uncharacterised protein [Mycobacteroides abscessus subsp. abscessus]
MTLDSIEKLMPAIRKAAKSVAYEWPGVVEADDVEQAIYVELLESPGTVAKVEGYEERAKYRFLARMGHQIASRERTDYDYYKGAFNYSVADAKNALKRGILTAVVIEKGQVEIGCDLFDALGALKIEYIEAIYTRYALNEVPKDTKSKDTLKNGLARLTDEMNKVAKRKFSAREDGPGTRAPVKPAAAQYLSKEAYNADYSVAPAHLRTSATEKEVWE